MKYLILTEGSTELALINSIIDKGLFKIDVKDILDEQVFHKRQLDGYLYALIRSLPRDEKITIIRIGDTLKDKLKVDKSVRTKVAGVLKVCTKPELEKLIIINEELRSEFNKVKDKPSVFLKKRKIGFNKQYNYIYDYFYNANVKEVLKEYKRIKKHNKDELYLFNFLK